MFVPFAVGTSLPPTVPTNIPWVFHSLVFLKSVFINPCPVATGAFVLLDQMRFGEPFFFVFVAHPIAAGGFFSSIKRVMVPNSFVHKKHFC